MIFRHVCVQRFEAYAADAGVPERWNPLIAGWAGWTVLCTLLTGAYGFTLSVFVGAFYLPTLIERSPRQ